MKGARKSFQIKDFSGGLVTKSPPKNIDMKFSTDCLNVYAEGAMVRRRDGITVLNPTTASGNGNGIYNWVQSSSSQYLMGFWGASLFKMDEVTSAWDGVWDAITAHSASGAAFTTGGFMHFTNYNGVLLMATEGYDRVQKMTIADPSHFNIEVGGTGTAPRCKYLANWKNHAWFINCENSVDQVAHSAVNSYNNFTGDTYGTNLLLTENDIGCTGWFILSGKLYVMKGFSIHRFTYTGSPSPLVEIRVIKSTTGTKSPRSVRNVNTPEGEMVIFLGTNRKLYMFDGMDTKEISDSIDTSNGVAPVYMQNINTDTLNACHAVVHEDLNHYELFVCVGTATAPTHSIVYDYMVKSFWPMSNRIFSTAAISDNGAGRRRAYVQGATNGKAYLVGNSNSDDSTAINAYWVSEKIGTSTILQRIDEVEIETDSIACTPAFAWRADWETAWTSNTLKTATNTHNFSPSRIDNLIQFRVLDNSTNPAFRVWTIIGSERVIGGGK